MSPVQSLTLDDAPGGLRSDIPVTPGTHAGITLAAAVGHPGDAQKFQVPGECCLRDVHTLFFQPLEKLFLAVNLLRVQDAMDQAAPRFLAFQFRPPVECL